jgi:formylglycine-generating enzyme required for sulfatase activity
VAHEALIREWGTLRKWLNEDRDSLRLHRHLTESAQEWQRRGKEAGELYRGARLKQLQDWMKEHGDGLSPLEGEFLKLSQNVKKQERLRWFSVAGVGVVLLLMIVLAVTGKLNRFIYRPVDMENYWVTIPDGKFLMGSSDEQVTKALKICPHCDFSNEQPQHWIDLPEYQIGKYEVTKLQYAQCIKADICVVGSAFTEDRALHPVLNVSWYDANAYCEWVGGRLPTEAEWEKAARGTDGRIYPWGESIDCSLANYYGKDNGNDYCVGDTTPVGSYPAGVSPYGVYDMAGNVWEWTSSLYQSYPYDSADGRENMISSDNRVLRGGSGFHGDGYARSAYRYNHLPSYFNPDIGFRCARSLP